MTIGVIGIWHLGEIYSACLAELGHKVIGIDKNQHTINNLNNAIPPLDEPHLHKLLARHLRAGRLKYSSQLSDLKDCDVAWVTIDTPVGKSDKANTEIIFSTIKEMAPYLRKDMTIIVSSQLPVKSSAKATELLKSILGTSKINYAYVPENLRLGEGVASFLDPGRIVIGTQDTATYELVRSLLERTRAQFLEMSTVSAEMVKHATNSFLATSLSFIYDIADACEIVGADVINVSRALKADPRIGERAYLDASIGFSGGTLGRDLQYLLEVAKPRELRVIKAVMKKNKERKKIVFDRLQEKLTTYEGKNISFFGITYKSGTSTLRRSLAIEIAKEISRKGSLLSLCDPLATESETRKVLGSTKFKFSNNPYESASDCHAIVMITPWPELKDINFPRLSKVMKSPRAIFDARNFFYNQESTIRKNKFNYLGVGR